MLKKRLLVQATSLLMSATVICPTYSAVSVYAAEDSSEVGQNTATEDNNDDEQTPGGDDIVLDTNGGTTDDTNGGTDDNKDNENDDNKDDQKPENAISVFYNGASEPIYIDEDTSLQDFVSRMMESSEIQFEDFRLDMVDGKGMRTRLLTGSDTIGESKLSTVSDLYELVQSSGSIGLVVFNDTQEIARWAVNTSEEEDTVAVDTTTETPYKVVFQGNGGTLDKEAVMFRAAGEALSYIEAKASYDDNHTFAGWYDAEKDGNEVTEATVINGDLTVYAHWTTAEYKLMFDSQGGSAVEPIAGTVENTITDLPTPTREGYVFQGWYDAATGGNQVTTVSLDKDVTLYARWKAADYQLTFDSQGGSTVSPISGSIENTITDLPTSTRDGYTFAGWYDAAEGGSQVVTVALDKDMTVYAHWNPITYYLNFSAQGGNVVQSMTGTIEDTITDLPTPTKAGYTFEGWYDAAEGGNLVTSVKMDKDTTLYAHWKEATYVVTLDDGNGNVTTAQGTVGKTFTDFPTPSRDGYAFLGWYTEKDGGSRVTSYRGDKDATFYAHWEKQSVDDTNGGNNGNGNGNSDNTNGGTNGTDNVDDEQEVETYLLTLVLPTGSTQEVSVKDTVQLGALADKLGYSASSFALRTYDMAETDNPVGLDSATTMKAIAEKAENGEVLIIAYNSEGSEMGSAKVTKTDDLKYTVTLSKDTNVALKGKGVGEDENPGSGDGGGSGSGTSAVSQEGKGDSVAESVQTADAMTLPLYGGLGGAVSVLTGLWAYLRRKKFK